MNGNAKTGRRTIALLGVFLAALVLVGAGFAVANDDPTGSEVLTDVEDRYESADSVVTDATVTLEHNGTTSEFDVHAITTNSGQLRVNVSNGTEHAVVGQNGNTSWLAASTTNAPFVVRDGTVVDQPVVGNVSSGLLANETRADSTARAWGNENASLALENLSVSNVLEKTNGTAEFVDTTTLDDQPVHVVRTTTPEHDGHITLWTSTDTSTVVKYQVTTPNGTMTVNVSETHFDVSPAESTFQPPNEDDWTTTVDSIEALQSDADGPVAVPDERWSFEEGRVVVTPVSAITSHYTANGSNVTIIQSTAPMPDNESDDHRTVEFDNRTVTVTDSPDEVTIARWSEADRSVVVVSDLSESELLDVVAGIEFVTSGR